MKLFIEELKKLEKIKVKPNPPKDFLHFWKSMKERSENIPLALKREKKKCSLDKIDYYEISFNALDKTRIYGKLLLPPEAKEKKVPVIIHYHGAGGWSSTPDSYSSWILMGAAVIACDFRNQSGKTGSESGCYGEGPTNFMGIGIMDKEHCGLYYLFTDAYRTVEVAKIISEIDSERIAVTGGSQGGGVSLAVAALHKDVKLCMADVPSSCWFEKRIFDKSGGAADISNFIKNRPETLEKILNNLSYFDNVNLAPLIKCPVLVSCGLRDPVCPPQNVYAAFNNIKSEKKIYSYVFAQHEGGGALHTEVKLDFFKKKLMK
ncbi:MAG TPA: acetylxylan esterase [Victivallales bacterium]|nr:acetylxylan esterase [Victivallales bacterium]HRR05655.1 acetylxylan esterase [Victivallales bacterium]HRR28500.1 acetylxylan esterase [Victivallales bacterium]HRU00183.1 acetylxylan esterase [Victivallales bacterium]